MAISLDKILNISVADYIKASGFGIDYKKLGSKTLVDSYVLVGVYFPAKTQSITDNMREFAALVPDEAELVINYDIKSHGTGSDGFNYVQTGIALIPRHEHQ